MYEGRITGFRDPDVPAAELGRLMAGGADGGHALEFGPLPEMDGGAEPDAADDLHRPASHGSDRSDRSAPQAAQATQAPEDTTSQEES